MNILYFFLVFGGIQFMDTFLIIPWVIITAYTGIEILFRRMENGNY